MTNEQIKEIALKNGFKLKEQPNGEMDLNPYVYDFARALPDRRWIGINDRQPEFNENVLAILKSGQYVVLTYMKIKDYPWVYSSPANRDYKIQLRFDQVVKWQPLSEPPSEVTNDI